MFSFSVKNELGLCLLEQSSSNPLLDSVSLINLGSDLGSDALNEQLHYDHGCEIEEEKKKK